MKKFIKDASCNLWNIVAGDKILTGDFTLQDGNACMVGDGFTLKETVTKSEHGVFSRKDTIINTSSAPLTLNALRSRFVMQRSEYEFYTQYNAWQNESTGEWSKSASGVIAKSDSIRTSSGAAPFLALWDSQTERGIAFHLIPDCSWSITAVYNAITEKYGFLTIEAGINADNLKLTIAPGETFSLPEIIYYEFKNKTDMDCYKLHRYINDRWPRRALPVVYNTWLYKFDRIDFDTAAKQIPLAKDLGCEYFVIDAGWFGDGPDWTVQIGDWTENMTSGFCGRLKELSDLVRKNSMKFGLWLEPTRAVEGSQIAKNHPEYFIKNGKDYFLDFNNSEAVRYILDVIHGLATKYGIEYFKFDGNEDLAFDPRRSAFCEYFKGYKAFMQNLRETYPEIYFEGCSSGGQQMNLAVLRYFDSIWPTDNQSVYFGTRLLRDTVLRMPPCALERWVVISSRFPQLSYTNDDVDRIISTGNATWGNAVETDISYLKGFMSGAPIGFSCDLTALSDSTFSELKSYIAKFKEERDFAKTAETRILADTKSVLVLQHSDKELKKNIINVFTADIAQMGISVCPVLNTDKTYRLESGETLSGKEIAEDGIYLPLDGDYTMASVTLQEI